MVRTMVPSYGTLHSADRLRTARSISGIDFQSHHTPQLFWTPVSLLTGERVLKIDRLSSVKPPFFHSLAAFGGERVEEGTGGGGSGVF